MTENNNTALVGEVVDNLPAPTAANPYPSMIDKMIDKGADPAMLDKLLDLQIKWEGHEARKAYVADMARFKAEPIRIEKGKRVSFRNNTGGTTAYDHAELSDVTNEVVPKLAKHGFSHAWNVKQEGGITVTCTITHARGHSESVSMTAPPDTSGGKNTIQGIASTKTYLERYTLLAACGLATEGQDDDGRGADKAPPAAPTQADKKREHWLGVAAGLAKNGDLAGYNQQREKLLKEYGGLNKVPREVKLAFASAQKAVAPKDEA